MRKPDTVAAVQLFAISKMADTGLEWPEEFTKNALTGEYEKGLAPIATVSRLLRKEHTALSKILGAAAKHERELMRKEDSDLMRRDLSKAHYRGIRQADKQTKKAERKARLSDIATKKEQERADTAEDMASATLEESLKAWSRFEVPGKRENTKARIQRAVHLYMQPDMRSERKVAARMKVTPKQVSTWFKAFTKATGFKVVTHKRNESVRSHTQGPTHRQGRKVVFHGEDTCLEAHNIEEGKDPFFLER